MNNRIEIAKEFAEKIKSDKIKKIILFGSVARGDDSEDSDIDILIVSNEWESIDSKITDEIFNIVLKYNELISAHIISEKQYNETKDFTFLTNVLKDSVPIG